MNTPIKAVLIALLAIACAFGQGQVGTSAPSSGPMVGTTTLSGASDNNTTQWCLASGTGVVVPSLAGGQAGSLLSVDKETAQVTGAGVTTSCFKIKRGQLGTLARAHGSSARVWIGNPGTSTGDTSRPTSGQPFALSDATFLWTPTPMPPPGTTGNSTTMAAGTIYWSAVNPHFNRAYTGACVLNGSTVGTDNHYVVLYNDAGVVLAQSAATLAATASAYQCIPFVTPMALSGERTYYIGVQSNGTTATIQTYPAGWGALTTGSATGTAGTFPTINPGSTFTANVGPMAALY